MDVTTRLQKLLTLCYARFQIFNGKRWSKRIPKLHIALWINLLLGAYFAKWAALATHALRRCVRMATPPQVTLYGARRMQVCAASHAVVELCVQHISTWYDQSVKMQRLCRTQHQAS